MNWYAYVGNDPINGVDPEGESAKAVVLPTVRGKTFVYPQSSHAHASKRHTEGYQGPGKRSPQQFKQELGMSNYEVSSTVVSSVVESGAEYYQTSTGNSVYTFETGTAIVEQGETAVSVATTPLSNIKDPAKLSEVATMLSEVGVSSYNSGNVEVVTTVAPDNGTFKRENTVLIRKQE